MENLMSTFPLDMMIVMFLAGSLGMSLGFDAVGRGKRAYILFSGLFYFATLPLIFFTIGSNVFAILGGILVSIVIGFLLMKMVQLLMIIAGVIRYEDIHETEETNSNL